MQYLDSTWDSGLVEMDMALSLLDCWEDSGVKFDVYDVGDYPTSVGEVFSVVVEDSERGIIPLDANTARALPAKQKDQRAIGKMRQRRTPKQEIERLRLLERNLKLRLETLQLQAHMHMQTQDHHIYPHRSDAVFFWKSVASRQYAQRIDSERENIRLKKVVKARIAHAKRLKRTMNQLWKR